MKKVLLILSLSVVVILSGCGSSEPSTCPFNGTPGATYRVYYSFPAPTPPAVPIVETRVAGADGTFSVPKHGYQCYNLRVFPVFNSNLTLAASPSSVYLPSPPTTTTITGQNFDTTYGMPMVEYLDSNGYLVGAVNATSVASNGTSLQANMPDLSNVYSGTYQVKVTNKSSDGYYLNIVGSATMSGWGRDRTDSDGDGWYDNEDCSPYDPYLNYNCNPETCGGYGTTPRYICDDQVY